MSPLSKKQLKTRSGEPFFPEIDGYSKTEADENVPRHQMSASVIINPVTNINGYSVGYSTGYKATLVSGTYPYYHITNNEDDTELNFERASDYIRRMSGTYFVPKYNEDTPRNSLWITASGELLKPQYDTNEVHKMKLYIMTNPFAFKANFVTLTQEQYDELETKDPNTYYFIKEEEQQVSLLSNLLNQSEDNNSEDESEEENPEEEVEEEIPEENSEER